MKMNFPIQLHMKGKRCSLRFNYTLLLRKSLLINVTMLFVFFCCRQIRGPKVVSKSKKPYVNNEEDAYLTLDVLAAVLEKLSESGKGIHLRLHLF